MAFRCSFQVCVGWFQVCVYICLNVISLCVEYAADACCPGCKSEMDANLGVRCLGNTWFLPMKKLCFAEAEQPGARDLFHVFFFKNP